MKKFVMMLALVGVCSSSFAHIPEGRVFGVFQWPSNNLPVLDGDISEWDAVPDELWIDLDDPDMVAGEGDVGREKDRSDIYFRFAMGWNDETDRLYYVYDRYDDVWDRDGGGIGCCGQDDSIEIGVDADHAGGWFHSGGAGISGDLTDEENALYNGGSSQTSHYRWPTLAPFGWSWFWMSNSTWHGNEPHQCCEDSFNLDGAHGGEANFQAEWYTVAWDDFNYNGPELSVPHDFVELDVIGAGLQIVDNDNGPEDAEDTTPWTVKWSLGGASDVFGNAGSFADFVLMPLDEAALATAVENDSWGHIKASMNR